ncbi:MAG: FG-GAP-like repeat-containing protein [Verrucomicrobia subdivision 3 bacterium]|nr:FG-GAP-like repeat-containing protein [Limisphaerales bacterium]
MNRKTKHLIFTVLAYGLVMYKTVLAQPVITNQPQNQTNIAGTTAIFTVGATGVPPLSYQWRSHASATVFTNVPWSAEATLLLTNVQPTSRRFGVVVTDAGGLSATSTLATLTVLGPPSITTQPTSQTVEVGGTASFRVTTTGTTPFNHQWRFNELVLAGKTNASLVLTNVQPVDAGNYTVNVSNVAGSVTSTVATLTVRPAQFTKVISGPVGTDRGSSFGASWGDYDSDGYLDLYVVNCCGQMNYLYHNNRDGTFTRVTNGIVAAEGANGGVGVWGDFDNDGALDLFATNYEPRPNFLYRNNGDGSFTKITNAHPVALLGQFASAAWGDADNDGYIDLYVVNQNFQRNFFYRNQADGTFGNVTNDPIVVNIGGLFGCAWGDYDNDGDLDFFICDNASDSANRLYRNEGQGSFIATTTNIVGSIANENGRSHGCAWGDYDNDGDLDLFTANGGGVGFQGNFLYRNNGNGTFSRITSGIVVTDPGTSESCAWADYDNDGFLDLFVSNFGLNGVGANNFLYRNNGDGTFTKVTTGPVVNHGGASLGCAWSDYDNDGFPDLFVANLSQSRNGANFLYRNNGNSNAWLKVKCVGAASNRSAIGAKVRVKAIIAGAARWQMREVSGGSGYVSQNSLDLTFGLGDATIVDLVRVEWPSGIIQEILSVAPRQALTITEPPRLRVAGLTNGGFQLLLSGCQNLIYAIEASTNLAHWSVLAVVTNLSRTIAFTDADAPNSQQRFYRARVQLP